MSDPIGSIGPSHHLSQISTQPVRVAVPTDLPDVYKFVYECYRVEGYCGPNESGRCNLYPWLDELPETTVLIVRDQSNRLVATCSTTIDLDDNRYDTVLNTELTFPEETRRVRDECRTAWPKRVLVSAWRFVIHPDYRGLTGLFAPLVTGTLADLTGMHADRLICSVHPKHERRWTRLLGMEKVAGPVDDVMVNGAPAILMLGHVGRMRRWWKTTRRDFESHTFIRDIL